MIVPALVEIAPPLAAVLPVNAVLVSVKVPALVFSKPPPFPPLIVPPLMVRFETLTLPLVILSTRLTPPPLMMTGLAAGPVIVKSLSMASSVAIRCVSTALTSEWDAL